VPASAIFFSICDPTFFRFGGASRVGERLSASAQAPAVAWIVPKFGGFEESAKRKCRKNPEVFLTFDGLLAGFADSRPKFDWNLRSRRLVDREMRNNAWALRNVEES